MSGKHLSVSILDQAFQSNLMLPGVRIKPESYSFASLGGPDIGKLTAYGSKIDIWRLIDWLRAPVNIYDMRGDPVWWGYLHGVTVRVGAIEMGLTLEGFSNRVAVAYVSDTGARLTTSWVEDAESVSKYGSKEILGSLNDAQQAMAELYRTVLLNQLYRPQPSIAISPGSSALSASLELRGWWHTLDWQYCSQIKGEASHKDGSQVQQVGNVAGNTKVAQSFQADRTWFASTLSLHVKIVGAPADSLVVAIYSDSGGSPGGLLGSVTITAASLSTTAAWASGSLATPTSITASTPYWFQASRTGALDAVNYYEVSVDEGLGYPDGSFKIYDGGAWVARTPDADMLFSVIGVNENLSQITDLITNFAQFITEIKFADSLTTSGVYTAAYRSGDTTTLAEVLSLLKTGTNSGKRLLAKVLFDRTLYIYEEPSYSRALPKYYVNGQGDILDKFHGNVLLHTCPVGDWCQLLDVIPASIDVHSVSDATYFFIEKSSYQVQSGRLNIEPRMPGNPWDVGGFDQG